MRLLVLAIGAIGASGALAQTVTITPSVDSRLTFTDNVGASRNKEADWIAEISPGIRVSRESGRFNGQLSAQLRNVAYADQTDRNTSFLTFQGSGEIEPLEDLLFVDFSGNVSRNNLSAFSGRSAGDDLNTDEDDETRAWSIGPRLQFRLGPTTQGSVRYVSRWLESGGSTVGDQREEQMSAQLDSSAATRYFGWGLDYSRTNTEYARSATPDVMREIGRATLYINLSQQLRLRAIAGREANDYAATREEGDIVGGGFDWYPTERTSLSATVEDRIFGTGHNLSFRHRMSRSTFDLNYSKDISSSLQTLSGGIYEDPLFLLFYNDPTWISVVPDNAQREATVRLYLGYPPTGFSGPIVTNAQFLAKTWRVAYSLSGVRNTLTISAQQSDRSRLSAITGLSAQDDFAMSDSVKTSSATISLSHSISGLSSLTAAVTRSRSEGDEVSGLDTKRLTATLGVNTRLGPRTNAGLSYRFQRADGSTSASDFTENSLTATLGVTF